MTQNEKFDARDVAFRWAKELYPMMTPKQQMEVEADFPELKESKDEKIRKWLVSQLKIKSDDTNSDLNSMINKAISWLEKQGKQKLQGKSALEAIKEEKVDNANKIEPRQEKLTEFERAVKQVMEEAIECGDTHNLKADAEMLYNLARKPIDVETSPTWKEHDEMVRRVEEAFVRSLEKFFPKRKSHWRFPPPM